MDIQIPQDQRAFVESLIAAGKFSSAQEVVSRGIQLIASQEKLREEIQLGIHQAERGELVDHDTVFSELRALAAEAKANGK